MKKPVKPKEPLAPKEPSKEALASIVFFPEEDKEYNLSELQYLIEKTIKKDEHHRAIQPLDWSKITIKWDFDSSYVNDYEDNDNYDYWNDRRESSCFCVNFPVKNLDYEAELEKYAPTFEKYLLKKKEYDDKFHKYQQDLSVWKESQKPKLIKESKSKLLTVSSQKAKLLKQIIEMDKKISSFEQEIKELG